MGRGSKTVVNQQGVTAGGDVVAGDKVTYNQHVVSAPSVVVQLLDKLQAEIAQNAQVRQTIEKLEQYYNRTSTDGIDGLEAKLKHAGRTSEVHRALQKKEQFSKLLDRWALYASAQQIFAYLLARAEHEYTLNIHPQIGGLTEEQVNQLVTLRIVEPTVAECGATVFEVDHGIAMGMVYWLAEQCFVRWH